MIRKLLRVGALLALVSNTVTAQLQQPPDQPMSAETFALYSRFFEYDNTLPLNGRTIARVDSATFVREKFAFDGWRGSRVRRRRGSARSPVRIARISWRSRRWS